MTLKDIFKKLDAYSDYTKIVLDLQIQNDKFIYGTTKYNLPTFEYYYENCVLDKGGTYDFTKNRFSTVRKLNKPTKWGSDLKYHYLDRVYIEYSIWNCQSFNYKEYIIVKGEKIYIK